MVAFDVNYTQQVLLKSVSLFRGFIAESTTERSTLHTAHMLLHMI